jgi:uncharacterized protein
MRRVVGWIFLAAAAVYVVPAVFFWAIQDGLVFPAPRLDRAVLDRAAAAVGARVVEVTTDDGVRLYGWHRAAPGADSGARRALLYFHGNAEPIHGRLELHDLALRAGADVVVFAYRGYPGSDGRPSEAGLRRDARAAWRFATEGLGIPADRVVVHGKSLGGGVAAALAAEVRPRALVLESTFTSVADVARRTLPLHPVRLLLRHPFDTASRAAALGPGVLVLHGDADDVIPVSHGRRLAALIPGARYVEVPGMGHQETLPAASPEALAAWTALLR